MSRPGVPTIITVTSSETSSNIGSGVEVILRARASNVQAISLNVTKSTESDPTGTGGNAMVLFPGESIRLPVLPVTPVTLEVKRIIFNDDTDLADPVLEIVELLP